MNYVVVIRDSGRDTFKNSNTISINSQYLQVENKLRDFVVQ